jgi:uroporphyrinogen-III decarboxylase
MLQYSVTILPFNTLRTSPMTDPQWQDLLRVIDGQLLDPLPVGLIIDSPWVPGWAGVPIIDYFADEATWLDANRRVIERFPRVMFLPGFWSEYGMCTEPSAFGAKCIFYEDTFPNVGQVLYDYAEIARLKKPDCRTDGLLPLMLRRLQRCRGAIEQAGHKIRFAVARGPLNIASYLLGHTEFLIGVKTNPQETHNLLEIVTELLVDWIGLQAATFDTIDGVFLLDDLIGFLRDDDFREFALPYLKRVYDSQDVSVKFLHNDAAGLITAGHLAEMGVNLFNFSFDHTLGEIRRRAGESVVLLGNIPPRDVLAAGTPQHVRRSVAEMLGSIDDRRRLIVSCGGGAPPDVSSENLDALCAAGQ